MILFKCLVNPKESGINDRPGILRVIVLFNILKDLTQGGLAGWGKPMRMVDEGDLAGGE